MRKEHQHNIKNSINADILKKDLIEKEKYITKENKVIVENEEKAAHNEKSIFQDLSKLKRHHQVLFSIMIIAAVVLIWRGIWNLVDRYWFPQIPNFSDISGIVIGIAVLLITKKVLNQLAQ